MTGNPLQCPHFGNHQRKKDVVTKCPSFSRLYIKLPKFSVECKNQFAMMIPQDSTSYNFTINDTGICILFQLRVTPEWKGVDLVLSPFLCHFYIYPLFTSHGQSARSSRNSKVDYDSLLGIMLLTISLQFTFAFVIQDHYSGYFRGLRWRHSWFLIYFFIPI